MPVVGRFLMQLLRREPFARWFALGLLLLLPWAYTELFQSTMRLLRHPAFSPAQLPYTTKLAEWQEPMFEWAGWWWIVAVGWVGGVCILVGTLCVFIAKRSAGRRQPG